VADNVGAVALINEAFGRGDVATILERIADDVSWEEGIRDSGIPYYAPGGQGPRDHVLPERRREPRAHPVRATRDLGRWGHDRRSVLHAGRILGGGEIDTMLECHVWLFGGDGKVAAFNHVLDLAIHERAYAHRE